MADVMQGETEKNPWRTLDWPPVPGHAGRVWMLPLVGVYYRMKDRVS